MSENLVRPTYRADIDGLRAIAILSVIGFHIAPDYVQSGFIGVDIFFVISGFLISTIIIKNLESNSFSFSEFYRRRINRIFPALILVLIICLSVGWYTLLADEYKQLGKHVAGGAGFVSNLLLWSEHGYFDNESISKPLLHLWSLGIEEQFYIFWPLLIWFVWQRKISLLLVIVVVAILSFILNITSISSEPVGTFYSPFTRFWELSAGSFLAYIKLKRAKKDRSIIFFEKTCNSAVVVSKILKFTCFHSNNLLSLAGTSLLVMGFIFISEEKRFPGYWAIMPVAGTVLLIAADKSAYINQYVLSNRVLVWFGLISFPLYLWHWPLLAFAEIIQIESSPLWLRPLLVFIAIPVSWATYRYVEKPIRRRSQMVGQSVLLAVTIFLIGAFGAYIYQEEGIAFRLGDRQEYSKYFENTAPEYNYFRKTGLLSIYRHECNFHAPLDFGPMKKLDGDVPVSWYCYKRDFAYEKVVFLWGDSHAMHLYHGLKNHMPSNWQILQVATSGCVPSLKRISVAPIECNSSNKFALETIQQLKPDAVIIARNINHSVEDYKEIAETLEGYGVSNIILMGPTPHWVTSLPKIISKKLWQETPKRTTRYIDQTVFDNNSVLQKYFKKGGTIKYADIIDIFCNKKGCLTYLGDDKKTGITSFDDGHLTPIASEYLAKSLLVRLVIEEK